MFLTENRFFFCISTLFCFQSKFFSKFCVSAFVVRRDVILKRASVEMSSLQIRRGQVSAWFENMRWLQTKNPSSDFLSTRYQLHYVWPSVYLVFLCVIFYCLGASPFHLAPHNHTLVFYRCLAASTTIWFSSPGNFIWILLRLSFFYTDRASNRFDWI